jgi:SAM-dependent methyltransferase
MTACLLCGGAATPVLAQVRDTRFGVPGEWGILACPACGLEQTDPLPSAAELKALYEAHYNWGGERGTTYTDWRERLLLSPLYRLLLVLDGDVSFHGEHGTGRLLDIGCNEGRGLVLYRRNGFAPEGLELNAKAAAAARARGFVVHAVDLAAFRPEQPFDRAVLSNVLEHALDPRAMLRDVHRILAPVGEVWISLPNARSWLRGVFGRAWINWHVPFHITHFTALRLVALLEETGFAVVAARQITPALWVAQSVIAWAFAGRPEQPRMLRQPLLVAGLMAIARGLLFPLLWLANRVGRGDCLVVKARRI